ncbi:IS3 family transposase [Actinospica robiniae]|uniref:Transposase n=1 Tax=Actinospica robiniae DSM 44927 TaxID=479430 RepID=W9E530_9ACTN|nr:IS3 family transposase [Actinospica robiniae]ETA71171.1 transposase [Actinospica robiniae DSM 44927]
MRFAFISSAVEEQKESGIPRRYRYPIELMCRILAVSRSGYYAWSNRQACAHAQRDAELTAAIVAIDRAHEGRYGIDRIHAELAKQGHATSQRRVRRLARAAGLRCVHPAAKRTTTTTQDPANSRGLVDLVERDFFPDTPNEIWYGDVTYIWTMTGWCYLATVIDGFSRQVIGWAVAEHMREQLVLDALRMAIARRRPHRGQTVMHTDRGSVYTGRAFRDLCLDQGILPSVGKTGICFDNAAAESFNALYKKELIHLSVWVDCKAVRAASFEYIETYYNRTRIQRQLGYLSPAQYESIFDNKLSLAA